MDVPEIATMVVVLLAAGILGFIIRACRPSRDSGWRDRRQDPVVKDMPSFDIYSTEHSSKHRRSRAIAAASGKR